MHPRHKVEIGDVVVYSLEMQAKGYFLSCSTGMYPSAICCNTNPFVLVSHSGDMVWGSYKKILKEFK